MVVSCQWAESLAESCAVWSPLAEPVTGVNRNEEFIQCQFHTLLYLNTAASHRREGGVGRLKYVLRVTEDLVIRVQVQTGQCCVINLTGNSSPFLKDCFLG